MYPLLVATATGAGVEAGQRPVEPPKLVASRQGLHPLKQAPTPAESIVIVINEHRINQRLQYCPDVLESPSVS